LLKQTPSLRGLIDLLTQATSGDMTVLLTGETGTGKAYLAGVIHDQSRRQDHQLLAVSCSTLSSQESASEIFGHVRGAFPGADRDQPGKLADAGEGTLLLDDVDALPPEQQALLLRVLETGEYEPVGGTQTRLCQARVIASSKLDLEEAMRRGQLSPDLYYRLRVLSLHLPPLRERLEDIGPLVGSMLDHFGRKFGKGPLSLARTTLTALKAFPWPGNIRQLQHVVSQAVRAATGPDLFPEHLPLPFHKGEGSTKENLSLPAPPSILFRQSFRR
jgi:DNA-binding NtrC family response regulator